METHLEVCLENREDLKKHLSETNYDVTIIKLTAGWCGPCKKIAPYIHMLNKQYKGVSNFEYIEIDVDHALDLYAFFKKMKMANGVPTFLSFKKELYNPDTYYIPYKCITGADSRGLDLFYKASLGR
jgi:thiol-disulfide isomerase/thioredoxin